MVLSLEKILFFCYFLFMLIEIIKRIVEKFKNYKNLYNIDLEKREAYYKEIEIFQDAYNFYKTHSEDKSFSQGEEKETIDFFKFLFNLGDFLTPLNFKDFLFLLKNKENQIEFSFLLLDCAYFFEDLKIYENLIDLLEKNFEFLGQEGKKRFFLKKGLLNLIKKDVKLFEKNIEKVLSTQKEMDGLSEGQVINQLKLSSLDIKEEIKNLFKFEEKKENFTLEDIIKNYEKSLMEGNFLQEKYFRNLLEKSLKEKKLELEQLIGLTEFLSKIDTYFLSNHSKKVRDMSLKICEVGKKLWKRDLDMEKIERGSYFHDLGKISIPWILMDKRLPLNEKEKERFKEHSLFTFEILKKAGLEKEAIWGLDHHKYINGKGYPEDNVKPSFEGNIICIAESFIGATGLSSRDKARLVEEIFMELKQFRGIYFYTEIVDALLLLE